LLHLSEEGADRTSKVPCGTGTSPLHFCGRYGSTSGSGKWSGADKQWSTASYAVWRIGLCQHHMQALVIWMQQPVEKETNETMRGVGWNPASFCAIDRN